MSKVSNLIKADFLILVVLAVLFIGWFINSRSDSNIGNIDLAGSVLTCEKDKKWSHYLGYFGLHNEQYYTLQKYSSCDAFKAEMAGKSLMAKYLKSNGLIVELKSDDQILYNSGFAGSAFALVFAWFLAFTVIRLPVRWLLKKHA
ncbi:hypothetical protein [Arsukibacterium sp.]|uniref:hypothetical protein n=1 Tax=Arsukibacterium sp. TaxID=1977258 RepID=UPI00299D2F33|nr:hypothetical protein [Arsukibacterium sp.]MDX1538363.1 hypothetical protein [Arsukibacterium sp.]